MKKIIRTAAVFLAIIMALASFTFAANANDILVERKPSDWDPYAVPFESVDVLVSLPYGYDTKPSDPMIVLKIRKEIRTNLEGNSLYTFELNADGYQPSCCMNFRLSIINSNTEKSFIYNIEDGIFLKNIVIPAGYNYFTLEVFTGEILRRTIRQRVKFSTIGTSTWKNFSFGLGDPILLPCIYHPIEVTGREVIKR